MKKHLTIRVTGLVQGVFFRASTKERAESLKICGFVRNESDGSVYIEAEGDADNLSRFVQWCQKGPPRAVVQKCEVTESELKGFTSFDIKR